MENKQRWLVGLGAIMMLVASVAGLVPAQWNHQPLPLYALFIVLALMLVNSRWVVFDFMGLRGGYRGLSASLLAWPAFFALAAAAKALMLAA